MNSRRHQSRNVGHVHEEEGPHLPGNLAHPLVVDHPRVGTRSTGDQLGLHFPGRSLQLIVVDSLVVLAHPVVSDLVKFAREVCLVPVREVTSMGKIHGQNLVARLEEGKIDRRVGLGARVRLHIHVFGPEQFLGPIDRKLLHHIDMFTTTIPAASGIAFRVLVGEQRALRLKDRAAHKVLRSNELNVILLSLAFRLHRRNTSGSLTSK